VPSNKVNYRGSGHIFIPHSIKTCKDAPEASTYTGNPNFMTTFIASAPHQLRPRISQVEIMNYRILIRLRYQSKL